MNARAAQPQIPPVATSRAPACNCGRSCVPISDIDTDGLPFAGELIQVRAEATQWEGAAERVLHNFALSLLVPSRHYDAVADLGGRAPPRSQAGLLPGAGQRDHRPAAGPARRPSLTARHARDQARLRLRGLAAGRARPAGQPRVCGDHRRVPHRVQGADPGRSGQGSGEAREGRPPAHRRPAGRMCSAGATSKRSRL